MSGVVRLGTDADDEEVPGVAGIVDTRREHEAPLIRQRRQPVEVPPRDRRTRRA